MVKQSSKQDGRPAFMFFPSDWLSSPDLNSCSLEAQGLWIKMLCIMYQSPERGVLLLSSGKQIDNKTLAKICGTDEQTINKLLAELEDAGVFSRLDNQAIYNRRMYREGKISEARSKAGSWERKQQKSNKRATKVEQNAETVTVTETVTEYKSINKDKDEDYKEEEKEFQLPDYIKPETWNAFVEMRKKIRKPLTDFAIKKLLNKLERFKQQGENIEKVLEQSIINCWQDVFPVRKGNETKTLPKFNEDKEFMCYDCKHIFLKAERQYGEDGQGRCNKCHKRYIQRWEEEHKKEIEEYKKNWVGMSEEQRKKHIEFRKKFKFKIPDWMEK